MKRRRSASEEGDDPKQPIDAALLEEWALSYLGRYASTAENLRQVLRRRVRRFLATEGEGDREAATAVEPLIDALVKRYRETGLVNDAAFAAGRARRGVTQGRSLRRIAAGLAAKGVGAEDTAAAIASLRDEATDPELAAAIAVPRRRPLPPPSPAAAASPRSGRTPARASAYPNSPPSPAPASAAAPPTPSS